MINANRAKQMIADLNSRATRLSDLITNENQRRAGMKPAEGEKAAPPVRWSDEQRGSYERAVRELEYIRQGNPKADAERAQEQFDKAMDELAAGIAALDTQEAQARA